MTPPIQRTDELIRVLAEAGVEFIIVGGVAAVVHGSSMFTVDFDIAAPFTATNLNRLVTALKPHSPQHALASPRRALTETVEELTSYKNLYLMTQLGRLDVLSAVTGLGPYEVLIQQTDSVQLSGQPCRVLTLDALISAKERLGREKDQLVARELRAIRDRRRGKP